MKDVLLNSVSGNNNSPNQLAQRHESIGSLKWEKIANFSSSPSLLPLVIGTDVVNTFGAIGRYNGNF